MAGVDIPAERREQIEALLRVAIDQWRIEPDPVEQRILDAVFEQLRDAPDFRGRVAESFRTLVRLTLQFAADRQDVERETAGERGSYLFACADAGAAALEKALQADYRDTLALSPLARIMRAEARNFAGGRVDVLVHFEGHRFVAEIKRELVDASRSGLEKYLGQAVAYQATSVKLGLLLVLDLTPRSGPPPHLESNVWVKILRVADDPSDERYAVVFRIVGNRTVPSRIKTSSGSVVSGSRGLRDP